jgi:hypothetical protein
MSTEEDPIPTRLVTVTCHTAGCGNAGIAITLEVVDVADPAVVCGVCSQPINDIQ